MKSNGTKGFYLYGLAWAKLLPEVNGKGVDDRPLEGRYYDDIVAVLSPVLLADFLGSEAEVKMQDINWIMPLATKHARVVEEISHYSPVLPAGCGAIFSSLAALDRFLDKHHGTIAAFLNKVENTEEWGLKGIVDKNLAIKSIVERCLKDDFAKLDFLTPGKRYLAEQRLRNRAEKQLAPWMREVQAAIAILLKGQGKDYCERKIIDLDDKGKKIFLNWAFLLERDKGSGFMALVQEINHKYEIQEVSLTLSGPWPPYSFCPSLQSDE